MSIVGLEHRSLIMTSRNLKCSKDTPMAGKGATELLLMPIWIRKAYSVMGLMGGGGKGKEQAALLVQWV